MPVHDDIYIDRADTTSCCVATSRALVMSPIAIGGSGVFVLVLAGTCRCIKSTSQLWTQSVREGSNFTSLQHPTATPYSNTLLQTPYCNTLPQHPTAAPYCKHPTANTLLQHPTATPPYCNTLLRPGPWDQSRCSTDRRGSRTAFRAQNIVLAGKRRHGTARQGKACSLDYIHI